MTRHSVEASQIVGRLLDPVGPSKVYEIRASFSIIPLGGRFSEENLNTGLELLRALGLVSDLGDDVYQTEELELYCSMAMEAAVEYALVNLLVREPPVWLRAGLLEDGSFAAEVVPSRQLERIDSILSDPNARDELLLAASRKVDMNARARIGSLGELAVIEEIKAAYVSRKRPDLCASIQHVSLQSDELGYDVACLTVDGYSRRKLEVKTCSSVGKGRLYLSRNEYRKGLLDPDWRLVVCTAVGELVQVAGWCKASDIVFAMPSDSSEADVRWETASIGSFMSVLVPGLPLE